MAFRRKSAAAQPAASQPPAASDGEAGAAHRAIEIAISYHARTKHHYYRYAPALGFLDWDTQPDPFRRYAGSELLPLPRPTRDDTPPFDVLFDPALPAPRAAPLEPGSLSRLFYFSLALSAWKRHGEAHWSLRVNPSSGNLHPTECCVLLPAAAGLRGGDGAGGASDGAQAGGVYHYAPREHGLERRGTTGPAAWAALASAFSLGPGDFLLALSSIHWRESWKYGERAWRYSALDTGHALAAVALAASLQGWALAALPAVDDELLAALTGLDRSGDFTPEEPETPELLAVVRPLGDARDAGAQVVGAAGGLPDAATRDGLPRPGAPTCAGAARPTA